MALDDGTFRKPLLAAGLAVEEVPLALRSEVADEEIVEETLVCRLLAPLDAWDVPLDCFWALLLEGIGARKDASLVPFFTSSACCPSALTAFTDGGILVAALSCTVDRKAAIEGEVRLVGVSSLSSWVTERRDAVGVLGEVWLGEEMFADRFIAGAAGCAGCRAVADRAEDLVDSLRWPFALAARVTLGDPLPVLPIERLGRSMIELPSLTLRLAGLLLLASLEERKPFVTDARAAFLFNTAARK